MFFINYIKNKKYREIEVKIYVERNKINPKIEDYELAKEIKNVRISDLFFATYFIDMHTILEIENKDTKSFFLDRRIEVIKAIQDNFCKDDENIDNKEE
jgi:hypothetical protein